MEERVKRKEKQQSRRSSTWRQQRSPNFLVLVSQCLNESHPPPAIGGKQQKLSFSPPLSPPTRDYLVSALPTATHLRCRQAYKSPHTRPTVRVAMWAHTVLAV